jgi:hypothetical protein
LVLQIHTALALLLFGVSPFTRLIHIYSFPFAYLARAPLLYRARYGYERERQPHPQPQQSTSRQTPQWVSPPPATPAEEPSRLEPVDQFEHALVRVAHPLRWIWQHPHVAH